MINELDDTVRQNQLACLPISRSGRAQEDLLDTYPQLAEILDRGKRTKIDQIAFRSRWRHDDVLVKSFPVKGGFSFDEEATSRFPSPLKPSLRPRHDEDFQAKSPRLKSKTSTADLMFEMDVSEEFPDPAPERQTLSDQSACATPSLGPIAESSWPTTQYDKVHTNVATSTSPLRLSERGEQPGLGLQTPMGSPKPNMSKPWGSRVVSSQKLDMKDIMAQTSSSRVSSISTSLAAASAPISVSSTSKMSQKERKRQQQQAALQRPLDPPTPPVVQAQAKVVIAGSPWQASSKGARTSLKDILGAESSSPPSPRDTPSRAVSNPPLTLRQTIPGNVATVQRSASENTSKNQPPPPKQSISTPIAPPPTTNTQSRPSSSRTIPCPATIGPSSSTPTKSIRYTNPLASAEPSLQLSMADILSQQQTEKDVIKEAAAKRSLQEIQEEQAFQEWWDQESRKIKDEEEAAVAAAAGRKSDGKNSRGRSRKRGGESKTSKEKGRGGGGDGERKGFTAVGRGEGSRGRGGDATIARGRGKGKGA